MSPGHLFAKVTQDDLIMVSADNLSNIIDEMNGEIVLVNIWASWCGPCREEMPDLLKIRHEFYDRGLRLMLISTDFSRQIPDALSFLNEQKVEFPVYLKSGNDGSFLDTFHPDWNGALPVTFFYNKNGELVDHIIGKTNYKDLKEKIEMIINTNKKDNSNED